MSKLYEVLLQHFKTKTTEEFLIDVDKGESYSFKDVQNRVLNMMDFIKKNASDKRFLLLMIEDRTTQIIFIFASWFLGKIPVLVNERFKQHDLLNLFKAMEDQKNSLIFTDIKSLDVPDKILIEQIDIVLQNCSQEINGVKEDFALGLFTSGTTNIPKLCLFSHHSLFNAASIEAENFQYDEVKTILNLRPHFTSAGTNHLWVTILLGKKLVLANQLTRAPLWRFVRDVLVRYHVDLIISSPTYLFELLKNLEDEETIQKTYLFFGGARLSLANIKKLKTLGFLPSMRYGMTEFAHIISRVDYWGDDIKVQLRQNSDGAHFVGSIYKNVNCTNKDGKLLLSSSGSLSVDGNEVFTFSEDSGTIDSCGHLYLVGRDDKIINVNGFRFLSAEIRDYFNSLDFVVDTYIYFNEDQSTRDYRCYLLVKDLVKKEKYRELIIQKMSRDLIRYKWPLTFIFVDSWPKAINGKIDYQKLI